MASLLTADLHLTARPLDEYRWQIFPFLKTQVENRGVDRIFIVGDLTDLKDNHNSKLVNRIVERLQGLAEVAEVYCLMGNHDYVDHETPFFQFINAFDRVHFITTKTEMKLDGLRYLMLPHSKTWMRDWEEIKWKRYHRILFHQPVEGSVSESGFKVSGVPIVTFESGRLRTGAIVVAGDIHVPQQIGNVTYCGAPYPIHFGDGFKPRILFDNGEKLTSIERTTIKRTQVTVESPADLADVDLSEGDQVRITIKVPRSLFSEWAGYKKTVKEICDDRKIILCGCELKERTRKKLGSASGSPQGTQQDANATLLAFCAANKVEKVLCDVGLSLLQET